MFLEKRYYPPQSGKSYSCVPYTLVLDNFTPNFCVISDVYKSNENCTTIPTKNHTFVWYRHGQYSLTLPETNIACEHRPPWKRIISPIGNPSIFRGENVSFREGNWNFPMDLPRLHSPFMPFEDLSYTTREFPVPFSPTKMEVTDLNVFHTGGGYHIVRKANEGTVTVREGRCLAIAYK